MILNGVEQSLIAIQLLPQESSAHADLSFERSLYTGAPNNKIYT